MPVIYHPPGPPPPVLPSPYREDAGAPPAVSWTGANGVTVLLSDEQAGCIVMPGARGLGMPAYQHYVQESGGLDGDVWQGARALTREVFLPIYVFGEDRAESMRRRRQLAAAMDPQEVNGGGEGVLELADADGTRRTLVCRYVEGMEGDEEPDAAGMYWAKLGILLHASQPFWERTPVRRSWRVEVTEELWLPIPPLRVRASDVIGEGMQISNPGSARSWPVWTITGPVAAGTVMRSVTLGRELELDRELAAEEWVRIDTRPRRKSVRDHTGANAFRYLERGSHLWPLAPGANTIDVLLSGADDGAALELEFVPLDLMT